MLIQTYRMIIDEIIQHLELFAPVHFQESYDNAGLITGERSSECSGIITALDATEAVIDEAISKNCNLVVAHHPIIFRGLKKLNGKNYVERTIIKAIKNDIAIYAIHTNLDNVKNGVNKKIAEKIGLQNLQVLQPKENILKEISMMTEHYPNATPERIRAFVEDTLAKEEVFKFLESTAK